MPEEFDMRKHTGLSESDLVILSDKLKEYHSYDDFEWDYECAVFINQSSFGEQAMLANGHRLVSVKCITDCYLAELHKDKF